MSLAALTGVAALRRASALTRRRAAGRRRWPAVLAGLVLSIPVVGTALLCAWSASVSGLGTYGGFVA